MPDIGLAGGLLKTAEKLTSSKGKRPRQSNLRRSISTSYYAVFHALAKNCADALVGTNKKTRPNKAWVEVYRGLSHGVCKTACDGAKNIGFPVELKDFSDAFMQLQAARHSADYDPMVRVQKQRAQFFLSLAKTSVKKLNTTSMKDKRAFATWVLITSQGARQARERVRSGNLRNL